eukprot:TRINITY_DN22535_c0_g1_i1.p1 TRINITY_DN22535_c0_g1~~TRINITY_DN22535_c0_g1_i1.p1  ORF type:complete len:179 (+),score=39.86 TRINITY_DN22535_c0_g1_i1:46-537(+)
MECSTNGKRVSQNIFFQKQKSHDLSCRLHTINNTLGRNALYAEKFLALCDEFDIAHSCQGSREFFVIDSEENLFSFILAKYHLKTTYYSVDAALDDSDIQEEEVLSVIQFNLDHVWCVKKVGNTWFVLDSLEQKPNPIKWRRIFDDEVGNIIVWKKPSASPDN